MSNSRWALLALLVAAGCVQVPDVLLVRSSQGVLCRITVDTPVRPTPRLTPEVTVGDGWTTTTATNGMSWAQTWKFQCDEPVEAPRHE